MEEIMSDPRFTDPRNSDPRLSDPVLRQDESVGGMWGWVAGLAVLALIAFVLVAGYNSSNNTASNTPPAETTTGSAPRAMSPSTTGSGSMSPDRPVAPTAPAPSTPPASR
jgi:hypothetical protein